jgi:hypothetical protein
LAAQRTMFARSCSEAAAIIHREYKVTHAPQAAATGEVERFTTQAVQPVYDTLGYCDDAHHRIYDKRFNGGDVVRYSDYAALQAELENVKADRLYCFEQMKDSEAKLTAAEARAGAMREALDLCYFEAKQGDGSLFRIEQIIKEAAAALSPASEAGKGDDNA